jgi:integrase
MYEQRVADVLYGFERDNISFTFDRIEQGVFPTRQAGGNTGVARYLLDVSVQLEKEGHHGNSKIYEGVSDSLRAFRPKALLSDVDAHWLAKYEAWLRMERRCKNGTIALYMRTLRAACNRAIKRDKILPRSWYPFEEFSLGHLVKKKINKAITLEDVRAIEAAELVSKVQLFARDMFLFSFYCRGMNLADIAHLTPANLRGGRIDYIRKKTGQSFSIAISKPAQTIIDRYKRPGEAYLFPIFTTGLHNTDAKRYERKKEVAKSINEALHRIARALHLPDKDFSFYTGRHSYVNILNTKGVDKQVIQASLGHTSLKTTEIYLNTLQSSVIDEADELLQ